MSAELCQISNVSPLMSFSAMKRIFGGYMIKIDKNEVVYIAAMEVQGISPKTIER